MTSELIIFRATSDLVKKRTHGGRQYLIAPVVALREGVLNGALVLADEFGKFPEAWNGIPLPLGHPQDEDGGFISCNTPDLVAQCPGRLYNVHVDGDRLTGEMWIDIEQAKTVGGKALIAERRLEANEPIEVSTAYFCDNEDSSGEWNGKHYDIIQRNFRPDHLALLLDEKGACNWQMGCGVPRVNLVANVRGTARTPEYDGTEDTSWAKVTKSFTAYRDGYYKHSGTKKPADSEIPKSVTDAPADMKKWIAGKSLLGDAGADNWGDLLFFPVVNPGNNKLNAGALRAVLGGRGSSADIPQNALDSAQTKARSLLDKEFKKPEANMTVDLVIIHNDLSLDEQMSRVYNAFNEQFCSSAPMPGQEQPYIREVFPDKVIVRYDGKLFSYPYAIDANSNITFSEPVEVQMVYQPVTGNVAGASTTEQPGAGDQPPSPEPPVTNEQTGVIAALKKLLGIQTHESGAPCPMAANCQQLAANGQPGTPGEQLPAAGESPVTPPVTSPVTLSEDEKALQALVLEQGGIEQVKAGLVALKAAATAERTEFIKLITANTKVYTAEELAAMSTEQLKKLRDATLPADFSGRGGPRDNSHSAEPLVEAPMPG
jgi:hypothetical protein